MSLASRAEHLEKAFNEEFIPRMIGQYPVLEDGTVKGFSGPIGELKDSSAILGNPKALSTQFREEGYMYARFLYYTPANLHLESSDPFSLLYTLSVCCEICSLVSGFCRRENSYKSISSYQELLTKSFA